MSLRNSNVTFVYTKFSGFDIAVSSSYSSAETFTWCSFEENVVGLQSDLSSNSIVRNTTFKNNQRALIAGSSAISRYYFMCVRDYVSGVSVCACVFVRTWVCFACRHACVCTYSMFWCVCVRLYVRVCFYECVFVQEICLQAHQLLVCKRAWWVCVFAYVFAYVFVYKRVRMRVSCVYMW